MKRLESIETNGEILGRFFKRNKREYRKLHSILKEQELLNKDYKVIVEELETNGEIIEKIIIRNKYNRTILTYIEFKGQEFIITDINRVNNSIYNKVNERQILMQMFSMMSIY